MRKLILPASLKVADMDTEEMQNLVLILSKAYLFRKNGIEPIPEEIAAEFERRTASLESLFSQGEGQKAAEEAIAMLWQDPD